MANNIYKKKDIKLDTFGDLNCKGVIASFSQGDRVSDKLLIRLTNDGVPLDLTDAVQVRIDFRKPDGKLVFQYCIMEDKPNGLISAILTTQTLAAPGKVYSEVTVKYPEGKDAVTRQFTFHVEEAIASDKSIESQNEWPMLERAIVAGDMFAGVDLIAIIQAGELAKGAVKKSGDTMTGNLVMEYETGKGDAQRVSFRKKGDATAKFDIASDGDTYIGAYDRATGKGIWRYTPAGENLEVAVNTNLVKKADAYTDYWAATGRAKSLTSGTDLNTVQTSGAYAGSELVNTPEGKTTFFYVEVLLHNDARYCKQIATDLATGSPRVYVRNMSNNVWGAWQEIISSLGGTLTGDLNFGGATPRQITAAVGTGKLVFGGSGLWVEDSNGGFIPWQYRYSDMQFIVNAETNLVKKTGTNDFTGVLNVAGTSARVEIDDKAGSIRVHQPTDATTSARGMQYYEGGITVGGFGRLRNGSTTDQLYMGWGANPWDSNTSLIVSNTQFTYKNKPVAMRDKDGRANLTLTAEGINFDTNMPLIAVRRGNTVTLKGAVSRKAGSSSWIIANLPVGMRPISETTMAFNVEGGGTCRATVHLNGDVLLHDTAKNIYLLMSYVVD